LLHADAEFNAAWPPHRGNRKTINLHRTGCNRDTVTTASNILTW